MTKVTFYQNSENQCVGFTSEDHAGYAQEGEDIVCAGISCLLYTSPSPRDPKTSRMPSSA